MSLGQKIYELRKKSGLSQEEVGERLGVSRQTVSKWETDQTVPELLKARLLAQLFNVRADYLMGGGELPAGLTDMDALVDEIDWTSAWSKKYPILASYAALPGAGEYRAEIEDICERVRRRYELSSVDAFLVVKDMLYQVYRETK